MIIIWRGWGILVPVFAFLGFLIGTGISSQVVRGDKHMADAVMFAVGGVTAGVGIWLAASRLESRPGRVLIDKASGREFKVGASAGSLFFIPTRYWALIVPGLSLLAAASPYLATAAHS